MSDLMSNILRLWQDRSQREQVMLAVMGGLVFVVLLQVLAVRPLLDFHARSQDDYAASMQLYRSIETDIQTLAQAQTEASAVSNSAQPLRTVAGSLALSHGISIARMVPSEDGRLTVNITRAETRALMQWLIDLETRYGIEVVTTAMDRESDTFVEATLVLQRRGG